MGENDPIDYTVWSPEGENVFSFDPKARFNITGYDMHTSKPEIPWIIDIHGSGNNANTTIAQFSIYPSGGALGSLAREKHAKNLAARKVRHKYGRAWSKYNYSVYESGTLPTIVNVPSRKKTKPSQTTPQALAIEGYYPLFENEIDSDNHPDGDGTSHSHTFESRRGLIYYMPNGLTMGVNQFHGDWNINYTPASGSLY